MRWVLFLLFAVGCGPRDSGFSAVSELVRERAARDVRWAQLEPEGANDEAARALLAEPLTADAAVQIALLKNRDLQARLEDLGVARAELARAARPENPTVEGDVQFERGGGTGKHLELGLLQSVSDLIYAIARGSIAGSQLEATKLAVAAEVLGLVFSVKAAFYDHQAAEQALELRRTVAEAARAGAELARRLHDAGNISDLDHDVERAIYEDARVLLARAEHEAVEARERVNVLLGLFGEETSWKTAARLPDPPAEEVDPAELEKKVIEASLELAALKHRLEATASQVGLARARGLVPDVALGVELEGEVGDDAPPLSIGPVFEVTLPLWDQGQGEVLFAEAELRRLQQMHAGTAIRLRARARAVRAVAESTRQQARHLKEVVLPLRARILEQTQLMHNAMQVGLFQLLMAKRDQVEAGREYVETLARYWRARAELDLLLAGGSSGSAGMEGAPRSMESAPGAREGH